jgi:CheY-like chemotaxis protein
MPPQPAVLIADDDEIFLSIISSMVQKLGYPVITAHNGIEAISLFERHTDDIGCVILDIHMPGMDGIMTLRHLRSIAPNTKVIIVSGDLSVANKKRLTTLYPYGCLNKPIAYTTFSDILTRCMKEVLRNKFEIFEK